MIRKILVAMDFEPHSETVVAEAADYALAFGAHLRLIHVVDVPPELPSAGSPSTLEKALERAQLRLDEVRLRQTVPCDIELRRGAAGASLIAAAEEFGADLIVMGTHGRSGLVKALMGSVAEYVVRRAPCPVLCLREQGVPAAP